MKKIIFYIHFCMLFTLSACKAQPIEPIKAPENIEQHSVAQEQDIEVGADVILQDLKLLANKNIALVVNQTSETKEGHLVDALLNKGISVNKIFAPEHGFRGTADAGESVKNGIDVKTGLPIISLYGNHKKPTSEDLKGIDYVIFDIQDVGARFYTYISTLHYVMEACAENNIPLMVLDRPNPNGHIVDGNVLDMKHTSFVGMHPIPILHGMTIGEYAQMIKGEQWLKNGLQCDLTVINMENYDHNKAYSLPIKPSPNLPDDRAIACYPSTCFFEGTVISEGRGTDFPFQVFGAPELDKSLCTYSFTPKSKEGAKYPKFENKVCYGFSIANPENDFPNEKGVNLNYLIMVYNLYPNKENFFLKNGFFDLLAGGTQLREAIIAGKTEEEIKESWQDELNNFKTIRKKYLLYPDFE
ncbi:MAG: DUF1343 domain-containing protein [Chitinophagales bacterium]|nr:DUF1343 domain-containing protein [Chitinophagales bacterium]